MRCCQELKQTRRSTNLYVVWIASKIKNVESVSIESLQSVRPLWNQGDRYRPNSVHEHVPVHEIKTAPLRTTQLRWQDFNYVAKWETKRTEEIITPVQMGQNNCPKFSLGKRNSSIAEDNESVFFFFHSGSMEKVEVKQKFTKSNQRSNVL